MTASTRADTIAFDRLSEAAEADSHPLIAKLRCPVCA